MERLKRPRPRIVGLNSRFLRHAKSFWTKLGYFIVSRRPVFAPLGRAKRGQRAIRAGVSTPPFDPSSPALHDGIFGLPHSPEQAKVVLIPVPWEPTTSYRKGTAAGPAAILEASYQVDLYDRQTGRPYEAGIAMLPIDPAIEELNARACALAQPIIDALGEVEDDPELTRALAQVNEASAELNRAVRALVSGWLAKGKIVGLIGGDHAAPFGCIAAHVERYPELGVLHIDAHADLRHAYEGFTDSHASIMKNVIDRLPVKRLVQVGVRDFCEAELAVIEGSGGRVITYFDADVAQRQLEGESFASIAHEIVSKLPHEVYISFDIDGLDPTLCPHTGTPVPGGLSFHQAVAIIATIERSGRRIVGFDLNEVAPGPEGDEWDANVGARLLYKLIGFTLMC